MEEVNGFFYVKYILTKTMKPKYLFQYKRQFFHQKNESFTLILRTIVKVSHMI